MNGLSDSPLSASGQNQAEELTRILAPQGPMPQPARLISSPKRRARETLQPLAESTQIQLELDARLDERLHEETSKEFETRVRAFLDDILTLEPKLPRDATLYLCSHLDWLEVAMLLLPSDVIDCDMASSWSNCEYRLFRVADGLWSLASGGIVTGRNPGGRGS